MGPDRTASRLRTLLLSSALLALALPAFGAQAAEAEPVIDRVAQECSHIPPQESPPLDLPTSDPLDLHVRVLFEPGDKKAVVQHMKTTRFAFERIGIKLETSFDAVPVPAEWKEREEPFVDAPADALFKLMKSRYDGERPAGVDIVYLFTRYWGGGMADCIGGVRYPDRAFAFGSFDYKVEGVVPVPIDREGVIAAHEIGHLLGAHHHYSNCGEATAMGALMTQPAVCTTMSPAAITASEFFGTLETSFIRYFTSEYAQD
jgi:hypothetical protein